MKAKRLLFLVMAICLASGVKAQFYDEPDDIRFYISEIFPNSYNTNERKIMIFNFDGNKACIWNFWSTADWVVEIVKKKIKENPNYFEDDVENQNYENIEFDPSNPEPLYVWKIDGKIVVKFFFSSDRKEMTEERRGKILHYKKVDKSFFKVGRSRTPSGTLHE